MMVFKSRFSQRFFSDKALKRFSSNSIQTVSGFKTDAKTFDALAGVDSDYLNASFEIMRQPHDSFGGYFHRSLGLPQEFLLQLQSQLLE